MLGYMGLRDLFNSLPRDVRQCRAFQEDSESLGSREYSDYCIRFQKFTNALRERHLMDYALRRYGSDVLVAYNKPTLISFAKERLELRVCASWSKQRIVEEIQEKVDEEQSAPQQDVSPLSEGEGYEFRVHIDPDCHVTAKVSRSATIDSVFEKVLVEGFRFVEFGHLYKAEIGRLGLTLYHPSSSQKEFEFDDRDDWQYRNAGRTTLAETGLRSKDLFWLLFDYGDNWNFKFSVRGRCLVAEGCVEVGKCVGKPPPQHRGPSSSSASASESESD